MKKKMVMMRCSADTQTSSKEVEAPPKVPFIYMKAHQKDQGTQIMLKKKRKKMLKKRREGGKRKTSLTVRSSPLLL